MPSEIKTEKAPYDPRWFIWTIVFLVVAGVSLVSYILLSDSGNNDIQYMANARPVSHTLKK